MIDKLKKIPFFLVLVFYFGYLGFEYYNFNYAPDGAVEQHRAAMATAQNEIETLKKKLLEGKKFMQALDLKRAEIQAQVKKLSEYQGALSEAPDVASLIKVLLTEAKKLEMKVDRIEPGKKTEKEYYLEQEFRLEVRGSYQQLILFAARVAQLQRILRIEAYSMKLSPTSLSPRATTVAATLSVRAYQYTMGKEDQIGKGMSSK